MQYDSRSANSNDPLSTKLERELKERFEALQEWGLRGGYHCLVYFQEQIQKRFEINPGVGDESNKDAFEVTRKADRTLVTTADRETELLLRQSIASLFSDDRVLGEEYGLKEGASGWTWYLDPIDGTQAFVHGVPLFGCLIGLEYQGVSIAGGVIMPALSEAIFAAKNMGCHWHRGLVKNIDQKCLSGGSKSLAKVSGVKDIKEALFLTTWLESYKATQSMDLFYKLAEKTGVFRGWGDCYGYVLVATGRAEIMVDPQLMVWDAAPMLVILEEAGGQYTGFSGERSIHCGNGIATNGWLHREVLGFVRP